MYDTPLYFKVIYFPENSIKMNLVIYIYMTNPFGILRVNYGASSELDNENHDCTFV